MSWTRAMAGKLPPNDSLVRIFRSLARDTRPWTLTRTLQSSNPSDLHGELNGVAAFRPKPEEVGDGKPCTADMVYTEHGEMAGMGGAMAGVRFSRSYIWRLTAGSTESGTEGTNVEENTPAEISVWFVKPGTSEEPDYLFHKLQVDGVVSAADSISSSTPLPVSSNGVEVPAPPAVSDRKTQVLATHGQHLCVNDDYRTVYAFRIAEDTPGDVVSWSSRHIVRGPAKDQDIVNLYSRTLTDTD